MDKLRIRGLVQGRKKLKDGTYAIGVRTKWGVVWITSSNWEMFAANNSHLLEKMQKACFILDEDLKGCYINVTNKAVEVRRDGVIFNSCRL